MRKLIVTNIVSLDGYVDGPGGNVMALPMDHAFDAYNAERLRAAGTLLLGRRTYDMFRGFWPAVDGDPAFSPVNWEISRLDNAIEKLVISDGLTAGQTAPWTATTRIVRRADAHRQVAELKRGEGGEGGEGGDILVFGSRTTWNDLQAAGLVDELHLMVGPVVLGGGTPAFQDVKTGPLRLLGTRSWEGSGNLLLRYDASPAV